MNFARTSLMGMPEIEAYAAKSGRWRFLILKDMGKYTVSHRLTDEAAERLGGSVSASATIQGPFDDFVDATRAAETKLTELKRMA